MTKADTSRALAKRLIAKFSDGVYIYLRILTEDYDITTGVVSRTYTSTPGLELARTQIKEQDNKGDMTTNSHFLILAAGIDITSEPLIGDIIETPSGTRHRISKVENDLYKACYRFYMENVLWV